MKYHTALTLTKEIVKNNPDYILCGSVALILAGVIPERDVSDLDFVAFKSNLSEDELQMVNYAHNSWWQTEKTGYKTYKKSITEGIYSGCYYNLFVHDKKVLRTQVINGIIIQNVNDILKYKLIYSREKDIADLNKARIL